MLFSNCPKFVPFTGQYIEIVLLFTYSIGERSISAKTLSKKQADKTKIIAPKGKAILRIAQKVQDSVQAAMQTKAKNINAITLKRELAKLDKRVENGELNFKQYQQARDAMFKMLEKAA